MPFDQSTIQSVEVHSEGADLYIVWRDSSPTSRWYQVYLNGVLSWHGLSRNCQLPGPTSAGEVAWVEVGAVDANEIHTSFASELTSPTIFGDLELRWEAGAASADDDLAGFIVSRSNDPNRVDAPESQVGFVAAERDPLGSTPAVYRWRSRPLAVGEWRFSVMSVDRFGNIRRPGAALSIQSSGIPPRPVPRGSSSGLTAAATLENPLRFTLSWPGAASG